MLCARFDRDLLGPRRNAMAADIEQVVAGVAELADAEVWQASGGNPV